MSNSSVAPKRPALSAALALAEGRGAPAHPWAAGIALAQALPLFLVASLAGGRLAIETTDPLTRADDAPVHAALCLFLLPVLQAALAGRAAGLGRRSLAVAGASALVAVAAAWTVLVAPLLILASRPTERFLLQREFVVMPLSGYALGALAGGAALLAWWLNARAARGLSDEPVLRRLHALCLTLGCLAGPAVAFALLFLASSARQTTGLVVLLPTVIGVAHALVVAAEPAGRPRKASRLPAISAVLFLLGMLCWPYHYGMVRTLWPMLWAAPERIVAMAAESLGGMAPHASRALDLYGAPGNSAAVFRYRPGNRIAFAGMEWKFPDNVVVERPVADGKAADMLAVWPGKSGAVPGRAVGVFLLGGSVRPATTLALAADHRACDRMQRFVRCPLGRSAGGRDRIWLRAEMAAGIYVPSGLLDIVFDAAGRQVAVCDRRDASCDWSVESGGVRALVRLPTTMDVQRPLEAIHAWLAAMRFSPFLEGRHKDLAVRIGMQVP